MELQIYKSQEGHLSPLLNNYRFQDHHQNNYIQVQVFGYATTLPSSGRRSKLLPSDERTLVQMFRNNPGTSNTQACHKLGTAGTPESLCTVKWVLHHHGLRGCWPRMKLLLQNLRLQSLTQIYIYPHDQAKIALYCSDETKIRLFGLSSPENPVPAFQHGDDCTMFWNYLLPVLLIHCTNEWNNKEERLTSKSSFSLQIISKDEAWAQLGLPNSHWFLKMCGLCLKACIYNWDHFKEIIKSSKLPWHSCLWWMYVNMWPQLSTISMAN